MTILIFNKDNELTHVVDSDNTKELDTIKAAPEYSHAIECSAENALQAMLALQNNFQQRLYGDDRYSTAYIMKQALYAEAELHEFLRELPGFKDWKNYDWSDDELLEHDYNAKEEYIDFLHFVLNIGVALGLTADEIMSIYTEKNVVNHLRQDNGY